ncbi:MAG: biotin/lipoate A/B protein ligase family protein [Pseudanabaenaceae cyanobacterium]
MSIDRKLLDWHRDHPDTWLVRFYDWSPPALSLGYHQVCPPQWSDLCCELGYDLVRRPSGGRAVLHQGTLTYMAIGAQILPKRSEMYAYICEFLIKGFQKLGLPLTYGTGQGYDRHPSCWHTHTQADLVDARGMKLIGSAQVYRQGSVLQHGSILLQPDPHVWGKFFGEGTYTGLKAAAMFANWELADLQHYLVEVLVGSAIAHFPVEFTASEFNNFLCLP